MATPQVRHLQQEAAALLHRGEEARVLEPSPPAVEDGEWLADDPVVCAWRKSVKRWAETRPVKQYPVPR